MRAPPAEFRTPRLRLRVPRISDAAAIFEEYAADAEVTRYMTWVPHATAATVADFLEGLLGRHADGTEYSWVITSADADRPFGMIGARHRGHKVDIGYVLAKSHWNRGYMSEAIPVVSDWLLEQPEVWRVWAVCDVDNIGSARALEKSGFTREGMLRRWIVHPNLSGGPRDCYMYGRVR